MRKIKIVLVYVAFLLVSGMTAFSQNTSDIKKKNGFALLELYTSEGCSSCPPADELMGKLQNEYKEENVYILAFHVDYWDRQGWKDIFSNADFTKRQYEYGKFLGKEPIYTPQLIVNGTSEYIGSQETIVRSAIKNALAKSATVDLSLNATLLDNKLNVNYSMNKASKNNRLVLVVVQKSAKSNVKRGENANRILSHFQIVRQLHNITLTEKLNGNTSINLPKDFNSKEFEVIGFVQNKNSGSILGAEKVTLN